MNGQNLKNYRKYYPLHHFIFYPVSLILLVFSVFEIFTFINVNENLVWVWTAISSVIILMIVLSFMLRQHYALGLQDRIIINEFKFRYFALSGNRLEDQTYHFSDSQIFALRFSDDQDLLDLINKTIENDWSSSQIKQNIKNWKADNRRI